MDSPLFWAMMTFVCLGIQGFYSMMEMACVSFSKVRLQYFLSKKYKRATYVHHLLSRPTRLFGTTLLGVNFALQLGSECSRLFYQSLELSPNYAPATQVILVLIFAELSPMFAARRFAEQVSLLGSPLLYASFRVFRPVTVVIDWISKGASMMISRRKATEQGYLTRDELQRVLEVGHDSHEAFSSDEEFDVVVSNIFNLRGIVARDIMEPIWSVPLIPSSATVEDMQRQLKFVYYPYIPVFYRNQTNIVGIVFPRDILKAKGGDKISRYIRPPWFISDEMSITPILETFKKNNQSVGVVLNTKGKALGILTLENVLEQIFRSTFVSGEEAVPSSYENIRMIERTFPGETDLSQVAKDLEVEIHSAEKGSLSDLIIRTLGHVPKEGESIRVGTLEFTVEEATLLEVKKVSVKTVHPLA